MQQHKNETNETGQSSDSNQENLPEVANEELVVENDKESKNEKS